MLRRERQTFWWEILRKIHAYAKLLFSDDTGEMLYSTPILNPGERVAYAQLDEEAVKQMKEGEYQATAFIDILDEKTQETIGTIEAGVKLTLKNS